MGRYKLSGKLRGWGKYSVMVPIIVVSIVVLAFFSLELFFLKVIVAFCISFTTDKVLLIVVLVVIRVVVGDVSSVGHDLALVSRTRGVTVVLQTVLDGSRGFFQEFDLCVVVLEALLELSVDRRQSVV